MSAVPETIADQLQVIHKDFIWRDKKSKKKNKHSTLIGEYADGGLRDLDIPSSLKSDNFFSIRRLFDNNFHLKLFENIDQMSKKHIFLLLLH